MYKLVYLPIAKSDIENIIHYVAINLQNKSAAKKLAESFIDGANSILDFPYGYSIYRPIGILKNEYKNKLFIQYVTENVTAFVIFGNGFFQHLIIK